MCVVSLFVENCMNLWMISNQVFSLTYYVFLVWIPACAGMTEEGAYLKKKSKMFPLNPQFIPFPHTKTPNIKKTIPI
jgi:hypothetical protein